VSGSLNISVPGDATERDADRLATSALSASSAPPPEQRRTSAAAGSHSLPGGRELPREVRSVFERGFGADLTRVRLHTDENAARSAAALGASAYSVGEHVVFGAGRYAPHTSAGRKLLAHELAHTLQPNAERRIARECESALAAVAIPEGDSRLSARARVDLGQVPIVSGISASIAGNFRVMIHVPRALQQAISGGGTLGGILGNALVNLDISGTIGTATGAATRGADADLCLFVTFHEEGAGNWMTDLRLLRGGHMSVPVQVNTGTPTTPPSTASVPVGGPVSVGAPTGAANVDMRFDSDATASFGPITIPTSGNLSDIWGSIRDQLRGMLALRVQGIGLTEIGRIRAALNLPVTIDSGTGAEPTRLPLDILGDLRLRTEVSQETGRFTLRLTTSNEVSGLGGLLNLQLRGHGTLSAPLPASLRLADLGGDFFRGLLQQGEGTGGLEGRLSIAGLPASFDANFRLREGLLTGDATLLSPAGVGAGRFRYSLSRGFSAEAGALGLTYLVIAPPDTRPESERHLGPYGEYGLGSSVVGLGATGVSIQPNLTQILALGAGPQFVSEPEGVRSSIPGTFRLPVADVPTGIYAGVSYTLITDFDTLLTGGRR
jgi:hypothetical protein